MDISAILLIVLFLVLLAMFLMIALGAKKGKLMKTGHADEKIIEPQKQEHAIEKIIEPQEQKQATEEVLSGRDMKKPADNVTITEQRNEEIAPKTIEERSKIDEPGKVTFLSGTNMSSDEKYFGNSIKEIQRIDQKIMYSIDKLRKEHNKEANEFQGLYITENEVNVILQSMTYEPEAGSEQKNYLRINKLQKLFQLDPFEVETLLICLAVELDMRYQKLYSYLQNDITKKMPSVDMVISLLCPSVEEKLMARKYFSPEGSLIRNRLILFTEDGQEGQIPLLSRSIKVDERIVTYLLGSDEIDHRIRNFSLGIQPRRNFDDLILPDKEKNVINLIRELIKHRHNIKNLMFFFHGAYGTGKKMTAEVICRELGKPLFVVDLRILIKGDYQETLRIIIRETCLQNSQLYLEGFDALLEKEAAVDINALFQELDLFQNWIFLGGELPYTPSSVLNNHSFIEIDFPIPSFTFRKKLWESLLEEEVSDHDINSLASKFNFSGGQIKDAISTACNLAILKKSEDSALSVENLYLGCKAQSNKNLCAFARKIEPNYTWDDIVLPKDLKQQLKEVSGYIKYRGTVYNEWGFDNKLSLGKGLNVLFSGPSGTGKTMAAEVIAGEADLDLYKIDLSCVVSKYIGETEKNLRNIFKEAETSNAILFFDEADALFGKRSEVRDSHDRYANIEINYLLQKMEEYEGIVILASNFSSNIDEAFLRRMKFKIDFDAPDEKLREDIWKKAFPVGAPVDESVDFNFLKKFKITGGNIKNIALSSAFLAAGNSGVIVMEHILRSTRREFQKIGKLCVKEDFGKYFEIMEIKDE